MLARTCNHPSAYDNKSHPRSRSEEDATHNNGHIWQSLIIKFRADNVPILTLATPSRATQHYYSTKCLFG